MILSRFLSLVCCTLLLLGSLGCAQRASRTSGGMEPAWDKSAMDGNGYLMGGEMEERGAEPGSVTVLPTASGGGNDSALTRMQESQTDRYLIKNGSVQLEVKDPAATLAQVEKMVADVEGYASNLTESNDWLERKTISLQVRVPAEEFEGLMTQIGNLGTLLEKTISAQDVTEEFVDTQAALRNLKAAEARLLDHLSGSKRLEDTLAVERELTRIRGEIEQREGRLRFLSHRIDFSTIQLTLQEEARPEKLAPAQKYSSGQEFSAAVRALVEFLQSIWSFVIWLLVWGVIWGPLVYLIRRARRPKATPPSASDEKGSA